MKMGIHTGTLLLRSVGGNPRCLIYQSVTHGLILISLFVYLTTDPGPKFSIQSATHFPSYNADATISSPDPVATQPPESPVSSSIGSPVESSFDEEMIFGPVSGKEESY